ncbi:MAG: redox-regulated ATPase YchF [Calditrichaeota bacterium]|nr:MAG: redox-regulated ATPase YchF [Calditrichota bacterium]
MGFKCGLVGLPNVGKSTIFNALTQMSVLAENYPFCTVEPNIGIVPLEDERLERIAKIVGSAKVTPTVLEFVDIAGLVKGASQGEGLGNQFLSHIQRVDAVVHIVRCFEDENVAHYSNQLDPVADAKIVTLELILKDLEWVENRLQKTKTAARSGEARAKEEYPVLEKMREHLLAEKEIRTLPLDEVGRRLVREMNLLTAKPVLFVANVDEAHLQDNPYRDALFQFAAENGTIGIELAGKALAEIAELEPEDQKLFMQELGLKESGLQTLVRAGFEILHLIRFYTANENEARAWTLPRGTPVIEAAGLVHSDFKDHFIKAEVIRPEELFAAGSEAKLREQGKIHIHGRDYVVQDGDLIFFRAGR